jgi:carbon monoxide dehydrogenase subunit G
VRVEESIEIARPPEEVWEFIADPANDPRWCSKVKSVEPSGDRRWQVMHKPVPMRAAIELTVEHVELEPPTRLTMREEDDASTVSVEYRLDPTATGTRFTQVTEGEWKRLPRLLHKTFERGVSRDVRGQLRALKKTLEDR